jgi:RHH-type transcriptional regulator, rel operon repressor / antitoxin RelB
MPQTTTMTVRLPAQVKARLEKLAKSTDRSKAYLASQAIKEYLDVQEWQVKAIQDAIREADSPSPVFYEHEEVRTKLKKLTAKRHGTE